MDNYFTDNSDILLLFDNIDLREVIELREDDFSESAEYDYAFTDADDAKQGYRDVLALIGEIRRRHRISRHCCCAGRHGNNIGSRSDPDTSCRHCCGGRRGK